MTRLLELRGVSKSFAGIRVLKDVDFDVRPGEVHALLGENGAGKSTLIKIISGVHAPDEGGIIQIGETQHKALTSREAARGGIATVYQELLLFPGTVRGGKHLSRPCAADPSWHARLVADAASGATLLDSLDSHDLDVDAKVGTLSVANRQRVEIAKALSQNARVLIMDEPTAALADADVRRLMIVVKRLRERGVGIVYVSHRCTRSSSSPTGSRCCAMARLIGTLAHRRGDRAESRRHDGRARHRPALSQARSQYRRRHSAGQRSRLRRSRSGHLLRAATRRNPRHCRPCRLRPHRAGGDHLRHHAGNLRQHRTRRRRSPSPRHASARPRHRLRARRPRPAGPGAGR